MRRYIIPTIACLLMVLSIFPMMRSQGDDLERGRPTRNGELTMDMNVSEASYASFIGENPLDASGRSVTGVGDVNGDGFDDIAIGSSGNDQGGVDAGKTYLIFGDSDGWGQDGYLINSDASFIGENSEDASGFSVARAGDVNNDGFDDILIGAFSNDQGGNSAGKTYLILGKSSGWAPNVSLSNADASFIGEGASDFSGISLSGGGDVNDDGFDDILIGAEQNSEGGVVAGQTYLLFGKSSGWELDVSLSDSDASFIGENSGDHSGFSVSLEGDVNNDGYDDILIGAFMNMEGGNGIGQSYLIFGKSSGWSRDTSLSTSSASFIGEYAMDFSGMFVSSGGDVNGDGYDDILINSNVNDEGGVDSGQIYIFFGKTSGWSRDISLSDADASIVGENSGDTSSCSHSSICNVNNDGFDDIIIRSYQNDEGGGDAGQVYLIFGKGSGWSGLMNVGSADASFIGEGAGDWLGNSVAGAGDVNGDGAEDILIGARKNDEGGTDAGQTYLISGIGYNEPLWIDDIKVTNGIGENIQTADMGETLIIEMTGEDSNITHIDRARVNVSFSKTLPSEITVSLLETGANTGVYKGTFIVPLRCEYFEKMRFSAYIDQTKYYNVVVDYPYRPTSVNSLTIHPDPVTTSTQDKFDFGETVYFKTMGVDANPTKVDKDFINLSSNKNTSFAPMLILTETGVNTGTYIGSTIVTNTMVFFENITAKSVRNPLATAKFMVHTPVHIRSLDEIETAIEDTEYSVSFYNFGYNTVAWDTSFIAPWLTWDGFDHSLEGTPDNGDVGVWDMYIHIADLFGHEDALEFQITVENTHPLITNEPVMEATEDDYYLSDLDCTDDEQGTISWHLVTDVDWLNMNIYNGELTGTPSDTDVGVIPIVVSVDDGNNGWDEILYDLIVHGVNDRPSITTVDITTVTQGNRYYRDYEATDPDLNEELTWSLITNATWLTMDNDTGVLEGTPGKWDVGTLPVTVIVTDLAGGTDDHEFNITVENINDKPEWTATPLNSQITHGQPFSFDADAIDPDPDTVLEYTIRTEPGSDMEIDPETGDIDWVADVSIFNSTTSFVLEVTIKVSDGEAFALYSFVLNVIPTESPVCHLLKPVKGGKTPSAHSLLQWEGIDPENDTLTYKVYIDSSEAFVSGQRAECLKVEEVTRAELNVTGLQPGNTYYWMAIPHDGGTKGTCTNGPFSFKVNNAPTLRSVSDQKASAGTQLTIKVSGSDADTEDKLLLRYSLYEAPDGMKINEETGKLTWTPSDGQTGFHDIIVRLTDGTETASVTFTVEVEEGAGTNILIFLLVGALILVIIALVVWLVLSRRKKTGEEVKGAEEGDEESERIAKEMDEHKKEQAWEKGHHREGASNVTELNAPGQKGAPPVSDVPLTVEEAHAKDKRTTPLSYEELYGKPAPPKAEESVTTKDLKEYISGQIEELESGKNPEPKK